MALWLSKMLYPPGHIPYRSPGTFESMIFPFPEVGYVILPWRVVDPDGFRGIFHEVRVIDVDLY